jgi:MFS transporter, DHA3 family, tetracycline resistance protein
MKENGIEGLLKMKNRRLSPSQIYLIYSGVTALLFIMIKTIREVYRIDLALLNPFQLVVVGTTLEITGFLFEIPTGIVADRYSRKWSVIIGLSLTGFAFLLEGFIPAFVVILVSQFILGLGQTFTSGADEAWIADETNPESLATVYLKGAQIGQLLSILGIMLGTLLASFHLNLPFIIGGISFVLLALFLIKYMPESKFEKDEASPHPLHHVKRSMRQVSQAI